MMMRRKELGVGIYSYFGYYLSFKERIRLIKEAGFDSTMVWWGNETFEECKKENVLETVEKEGLILENIHVPYEKSNALWSTDKLVRRECVNQHTQWLKDCYDYNIPMMVMHVSKGTELKSVSDEGLASIKEIINVAEAYGVMVAIENTRKDSFIEFILSNIESKYLGLCFDTSHAGLYSSKVTHLIESFGDRIVATHISDNDGIDDCHWPPHQGVIDWNSVITELSSTNYKGYISLEIFPKEVDNEISPLEFLKKAYKKGLDFKRLIEE